MKILPFLAAAAVCLCAHAASPDASPSPADTKPEAKKPEEPAETRLSTTEHSITVNGQVVNYKAVAGYMTLSDEKDDKDAKPDDKAQPTASPWPDAGKPKARIFFIAYTREGVDTGSRPITFAFNGGPGAASVWLHLGELGPRRVKLDQLSPNSGPPYSLVDNDQTWLTDTDLVFIDPVSTGYSRPAPGESAGDFHRYEQDLKSVAEFIRLYTTRNNRWLSPKFIVGESYGGTRAAGLCDLLQSQDGIYLNGVIVVSGLMNWQTIDTDSSGNDIACCLALPSMTETAWYYKKDAPEYQLEDVGKVRQEAEQFAMQDYLLALGKGDQLPDADRRQIAQRLSKYIGLPADYILRHHLRISLGNFREELLKTDGRLPGRYDSRYSGIAYDPDAGAGNGDASFTAIQGAFSATINSYLRTELHFESDLPYYTLADVGPWPFNSDNNYLDVSTTLARTMSQNPRLKVWVMCGFYDLAVPYFSTVYTLDHMRLDPSIRSNITLTTYDSGHMVYTDQTAIKAMRDDFGRFLNSAVQGK